MRSMRLVIYLTEARHILEYNTAPAISLLGENLAGISQVIGGKNRREREK
jgi:hypothetical protein